jgi:sortase A
MQAFSAWPALSGESLAMYHPALGIIRNSLYMQNGGLKRKLGWLEIGLYLGGIAMLAVFFQIRADSDRQREQGIRDFENAGFTAVAAPNQELWAQKRIAEYENSLKIDAGPPIGIMTIENLDIQVPVFNGADDFNLNRGVARIKGTATVDAVGNLGIAGHRDGFFRGLKDIAVGDEIELKTTRGELKYEVSSIEIVDPSDVSVLAPTPERTITLVTCYPFYYVGHAPKRYIVKATAEHLLAKT